MGPGYLFIKYLVRLVLNLFFQSIEVVGTHHVPPDCPVIYAAVHPNTLLDPCLLIATAPRPARFMAKDTLFRHPLLSCFMWCSASVPVKRRSDHEGMSDEERRAAVDATFEALYETLEDGGAIGIFPEGISHAEAQMAPLRSGMARIALGYVAHGRIPTPTSSSAAPSSAAPSSSPPGSGPDPVSTTSAASTTSIVSAEPDPTESLLGRGPGHRGRGASETTPLTGPVALRRGRSIAIVPCGLTYLSRSSFRSKVLVEYGTPIIVDEGRMGEYDADQVASVRRLTDETANALEGVTMNASDWTTMRLVQMAKNAVHAPTARLSDHVATSRAFMATYQAHAEDPPMARLRNEGAEYLERLDALGLKDHHIATNVGILQCILGFIGRFVLFVILLPFAVIGFVVHLPAYTIAYVASVKMRADNIDTIGTVKAMALTFVVPVNYLVITVALCIVFSPWYVWLGLCVLGLPLLGFVTSNALIYGRKVLVGMRAVVTLLHWREEVAGLRALRASLMDQLYGASRMYCGADAAGASNSMARPRYSAVLGFGTAGVINV